MNKARKIILISVIAGLLGVAAWLLAHAPSRREPSYAGKTLSEWLSIWGPTKTNMTGQDSIDCERAIHAMGAKSTVPFLLKMLQASDSSMKYRLLKLAQKQHFVTVNYAAPRDLRQRASMGLYMLGYEARSAVPEMIRIYNSGSPREARSIIVNVFAKIGPAARDGIPCIIQSTSSTNDFERIQAIHALGQIHSDASNVVPLLIVKLEDKSPAMQDAAARALGNFESDAKSAMPALTKLLETAPQDKPTQGYFPGDWIQSFINPQPRAAAIDALSRINNGTPVPSPNDYWEGGK